MDMSKQNYHRISVAEMAPHVHTFAAGENKVEKLVKWLSNWIELSMECGKIKPYDLLPSKADLACHIGVSQGTIQTVYRLLEDSGCVESKQRIGTYITDCKNQSPADKLTSKRELTIEIIKRYIKDNDYQIGDKLISARQLAKIMGIANTTIRMALTNLVNIGILLKSNNNYVVAKTDFIISAVEAKTLVEKVAESLKEYILQNFKDGERIPSNSELVKKFKVSIKTIHDAIKILSKDGFLYARRGQYGTIVQKNSDKDYDNAYNYEKIEQKIRQYMYKNCQVGDKLPTIKNFAKQYSTSEKTVKKALDDLAEDGYVAFTRGRYGGTFVLDMPEESGMAYKWLAISNDYVSEIENM